MVVAARTRSQLEAVVAEIEALGGQSRARAVDIVKPADVEHLADELREIYGRVDILVNSAGVSLIASLGDTAEVDWDLVLDINLKGPYLCTRAFLGLLRASEAAQVVNIASKVGLTGHEMVTAYSAAKAGLIGFGRALAKELSPDHIRVATICPGPVDTPMRWAATPTMDPKKTVSPDTVAETVLFLVTLDRHATTPSEIVVEAITYDRSPVLLD